MKEYTLEATPRDIFQQKKTNKRNYWWEHNDNEKDGHEVKLNILKDPKVVKGSNFRRELPAPPQKEDNRRRYDCTDETFNNSRLGVVKDGGMFKKEQKEKGDRWGPNRNYIYDLSTTTTPQIRTIDLNKHLTEQKCAVHEKSCQTDTSC